MIIRTFSTMLFMIAASDIFIYFTHIQKVASPVLKVLWFMPSLLLIAGLIIIMYGGRQTFMIDKAHIGSFYFMFCLALTVPKLVFAVLYATKFIFQQFTHTNLSQLFTIIALIGGGLTFFIISYGTFYGWKRSVVNKVEISYKNLPPYFDGFKIVHISDLHASTWSSSHRALRNIVNKINDLEPDVIMFTGDLVTHRAKEMKGLTEIISGMEAKYGVYSVLGNHDYSPYYPWKNIMDKKKNFEELLQLQKDMGWKLLNNEHCYIKRGNDSIAIIGVENWGEPPFSKYGNLPKALESVDQSNFTILLSHNPSHWRAEVLDNDIDLTLSGHTHAMQMKIAGFSISKMKYNEWSGLYREKNNYLYVNEGLGCTLIPFRFGAWPEITLITLKRK